MPEFDPFKIPRARRSARIDYDRALTEAVRQIAKGTGWRSVEGMLFQDLKGWWTGISPVVSIAEDMTTANVMLKPMSIDPVFWEITGMPENNDQALSFRYLGAFTCPTPIVRELEVNETGTPSDVAARILKIPNEQAEQISDLRNLPAYVRFLENLHDPHDTYRSTIVCSLIVMGREQEAAELCKTAPSGSGKFLFLGSGPSSTFESMALDWLDRRARSRTLN